MSRPIKCSGPDVPKLSKWVVEFRRRVRPADGVPPSLPAPNRCSSTRRLGAHNVPTDRCTERPGWPAWPSWPTKHTSGETRQAVQTCRTGRQVVPYGRRCSYRVSFLRDTSSGLDTTSLCGPTIPRGTRLLQGLSLHPPSVGISDRPVRAPGHRLARQSVWQYEVFRAAMQPVLAHCTRLSVLKASNAYLNSVYTAEYVLEDNDLGIRRITFSSSSALSSIFPIPCGPLAGGGEGRPRATGNAGNLQRASATWAIEHDGHAVWQCLELALSHRKEKPAAPLASERGPRPQHLVFAT